MDLIECLKEKLFFYLTNNAVVHQNIIRKHTAKLVTLGDFSFPIDANVWRQYFNDPEDAQSFHAKTTSSECTERLKEESKQWVFRIGKGLIIKERFLLHLDRQHAYKFILGTVLSEPKYGFLNKVTGITVTINSYTCEEENEDKIINYRMKLITNILRNLLELSKYDLQFDDKPAKYKMLVTTTPAKHKKDNSTIFVCSGPVVDPRPRVDKDELSKNEYIDKRSTDMQLMAEHKYGLRVKKEQVFVELIKKLGHAAVAVDLLEVKHSSPVVLNYSGCSTSKGAAFILYNSARLETLFRLFDEKVRQKYYPELPSFEDIDLTLLKEEVEWELLFNYIIEFPSLINRAIGDVLKPSPHLICHFLCGLVGLFSVYYRRVRILTENRPQLLPVMYARLYLLKCLQIVLNKSLALLDIEPIKQM